MHQFLMLLPFVIITHLLQFAATNDDFVERFENLDGEVITRLRYNNKSALQTSYAGYNLIESADPGTLVQMWYSGSELIDCTIETDSAEIGNFWRNFNSKDCPDANHKNSSCGRRDESRLGVATKVIEEGEEVPHGAELLATRNEILLENCSQFMQHKHAASRRVKRDLLFPGTKWCGSGFSSLNFKELGVHAAADRCCRDHDHCKHYISPFSWKYSLFNFRIHTVSHCRCDRRFRSCLKLANTPTANMIGKLFFNIGKTKCFTFKREKVCKKRSWWGTCLKYGNRRRAYFKNGTPY